MMTHVKILTPTGVNVGQLTIETNHTKAQEEEYIVPIQLNWLRVNIGTVAESYFRVVITDGESE